MVTTDLTRCAGEWRPVHTAPIDGTCIEACDRDGESSSVRWSSDMGGWIGEDGMRVFINKWRPITPSPVDPASRAERGPVAVAARLFAEARAARRCITDVSSAKAQEARIREDAVADVLLALIGITLERHEAS